MFRKTLVALALVLAFTLPAFAATPVNVNTANAQTIAAALDGIGIAKAQAIVAYRKAHGPFKSVAALADVKGVGSKTVARNHDAIRLSGHFAAKAKSTHHTHKKH